jgi:hypothetical protein
MPMQKTCLVLAALAITVSPALAANLAVKFTNKSGDSISQLTATPKDAASASTQNILSGSIANGGIGQATITSADGDCVFTLTFTFGSGKTLNRADTDLCQTDGIVVE